MIHILAVLFLSGQADYPLKNGRPTSEGIRQYVEDNAESIIREYEQFIGDTLYNVWISTDDLKKYGYNDTVEMGLYYRYEIFISDAELYYAYEMKDFPRSRNPNIIQLNKFVKTTILHELSHDYFEQTAMEMLSEDNIHVDRSFTPYVWLLRDNELFGSRFIEEGICEYIVEKMEELIAPKKPRKPHSVEELTSKENEYDMLYRYSAYFLRDFLDENGFKRGLKILAHNPPPTYEEILNPDLYFERLDVPELMQDH